MPGALMAARRGTAAAPFRFLAVPETIPGLQLWTKASRITGLADGDPVSTWPDLSGNARHFTQTGGNRPTYRTNILNGKPVVRLDGVNDYMQTPAFVIGAPATVFAVIVRRANSGGLNYPVVFDSTPAGFAFSLFMDGGAGYTYGISAGDGVNLFTSAVSSLNDPDVLGVVINGASSFITKDGLATTPGNAGSNSTPTGLQIGINRAMNVTFFEVDFAEFIVYDTALSSVNRRLVEAYLGAEYGVTVV